MTLGEVRHLTAAAQHDEDLVVRAAKTHQIFWAVADGCPTCLTNDELKLHLECRAIIESAVREYSALTPAVFQSVVSNIDWLEDELQEIRSKSTAAPFLHPLPVLEKLVAT